MKPVRYGMIGGGQGAFIGGVHRTAARIAGNWELVAGAFGDSPEMRGALGGHAGLIDTGSARRELGFRPRHGWREYPEPEKM